MRVRSWVVNLNPLFPLVVIFYQGERGGVEVEARWSRGGTFFSSEFVFLPNLTEANFISTVFFSGIIR